MGTARLRGMRWRLSLHRVRAVPDPAPVPEPRPRPRSTLDAIQERQLGSLRDIGEIRTPAHAPADAAPSPPVPA